MKSPSVALFLITLLWGTTFVVVKDALSHADPMPFLALRFAIGAAVGTVFIGRRVLRRETLRAGVVLSAFLFAGFVLQTTGLTLTTPSRSAFLTGLSVLLVPLVSWATSRRAPRPGVLMGITLAAAGLYLLTDPTQEALTASVLRGDALTLAGALAFACHISLIERWARDHPPVALVTVQLWMVALLSALSLPWMPHRIHFVPELWGALVFCGAFASAAAISIQTWAQARVSAVRAALIFSLEPVVATALSVELGRERLSSAQWMGGALILAGVCVGELTSAWQASRRATDSLTR